MTSATFPVTAGRFERADIGGRQPRARQFPAPFHGAPIQPRNDAPDPGATVGDPSPLRQAIKRSLDILSAGGALIALSPVLVCVAAAIKLESKGPILFRQYRYGRGGKLFRIYKFRTMYTETSDPTGVRQTTRDDPRVTPIGKFLRRMNLDELPQLLNILKGEMSLVGPRPQVPGQLAGGIKYEYLVPYYFERHLMRPGLTGLAQVNDCRGSTTEPQKAIARINYDLDYIESWSLALDIKIILRTFVGEFILGRRAGY